MKTDKLAIIGAGGHGRVAADVARQCGWQQICFVDDAYEGQPYATGEWTVVGKPESVADLSVDGVFVAIGNAASRSRWVAHGLNSGWPLVSLCAPSAVVSESVVTGRAVLIAPGAIVNIGACLGDGVIINSGAIVEHDVQVGMFTHVCPGAALGGDVRIGARSWIGIGSSVRHGITIGDDVMVGAGAAVVADVDSGLQVVGVPARARPAGK